MVDQHNKLLTDQWLLLHVQNLNGYLHGNIELEDKRMVWPEEIMAMVAQSQPFSYHCSVNFPCPHKKEHGEKRGHRRPEYDQPRRHRLREEACFRSQRQGQHGRRRHMLLSASTKKETGLGALTMAKLDADQKLYDAYSQRKPTERPHLLHRVPEITHHIYKTITFSKIATMFM